MSDYPKAVSKPEPGDVVQVLMTQKQADVLLAQLNPRLELAGPVLFQADDVPTYIIGIKP